MGTPGKLWEISSAVSRALSIVEQWIACRRVTNHAHRAHTHRKVSSKRVDLGTVSARRASVGQSLFVSHLDGFPGGERGEALARLGRLLAAEVRESLSGVREAVRRVAVLAVANEVKGPRPGGRVLPDGGTEGVSSGRVDRLRPAEALRRRGRASQGAAAAAAAATVGAERAAAARTGGSKAGDGGCDGHV